MILGRKVERRDQRYRQALTWTYNWLLRSYFGSPQIRDADSGFRLFNRAAIDQVLSRGLAYRNLIASEIVLRTIACGLRYHEVLVSYAGRAGESRGLPSRKIPGVVLETLRAMVRLKAEFRSGSGGPGCRR